MSGDTQQDGGFGPIELSAAVRAIRRELAAAAADGEGEPVRFEVGPIQLDLTVELTRETGAKGGVRAWVVEAGADTRATRNSTHHLSFTLTPRSAATGGPVEIADPEPGGTSRFGSGG
ncbi:trypco2 family protein [Streptacidiphilus albus]|uniref:trypco2 family protein n=1 Tax=Streptacidiphilus albus TaxID=105425 RepID=UPI00054C7D50|nr:trypco2 family protein [Streptacidiphilus albus]